MLSAVVLDHASQATSGMHARLRDAATRAALAARWRADTGIRVAPLLEPGLGAELAAWLGHLPIAAAWDDAARPRCWRASVTVPSRFDPQLPGCLSRLVAFLF